MTSLTRTTLTRGTGYSLLLARLVAVLRVVQLVGWPVAFAAGTVQLGLQNRPLAIATYAAQTAWVLAWVTIVLVRRMIPPALTYADVLVATVCLVTAGLACYPSDVTSVANSAVSPAIGAAVAAAAALPKLPAVAAVGALIAGYFAGVGRGVGADRGVAQSFWTATAINIATLVGFAVVAGLLAQYLREQATRERDAGEVLATAQRQLAAENNRTEERSRQYRMLHDTVLSTLSALARGGINPADPAVRQRIAADADYLRGIISSGDGSSGNRLNGELAALGREQGVLGLRVHLHCADIPADLPPEVVRGLTDASREALNNVLKHAGVQQAWVTALGETGPDGTTTVVVAITDRGRGFHPQSASWGMGLRDSIAARMQEISGVMAIDSEPGQGTTVELRWAELRWSRR